MRRATLVACLVLGNAAAQAVEAATPPPTARERALLAELDGDEPLGALRELEFFGRARHVPAIAAKLDSPAVEVRAAAARTLGIVAVHDLSAETAVQAALRRALRDRSRRVQQVAVHTWPRSADPAVDTTDLEALLADQDLTLRVSAAARLVTVGVSLHENDVAAALRDAAGTAAERFALPILDALRSPEQIELLRPYLAAADPEHRFRAREALARLEALAAGAGPDCRPASQRVRELGDAQNRVARGWFSAQPWREVGRDEVLARAAASRLVVFGETHFDDGPLREAQRLVLRVMAAAAPGRVVLGYEPSVASPQRSVIAFARRLGVEAIALETDWENMVPEGRLWERDEEAASIVNRRLAADPACRMLVIRGEGHTRPGSYFMHRLAVAPMSVLSASTYPPLESLAERADTLGRTFRVGDRDVYWWGVLEWFSRSPAKIEPVPSTSLERAASALLAGDQRHAALRLLADLGDAPSIDSIRTHLADEAPAMRAAAAAALGAIAARDPVGAVAVCEHLQRALGDPDVAVRQTALRVFPATPGAAWQALEPLLGDSDVATRLAAAGALVRCGVTLHPDHATAALRDGVGSAHAALLLPLFDRARVTQHADLLRPYLASTDPAVRDRVRFLCDGVDAEARGERYDWFPLALSAYADDEAAATARRRGWEEIALADVLREVAGARLVLFGDGARSSAALQTARLAVLRAMVTAAPRDVVLAADPTLAGAAEIAAAARELGAAVLELERGWREQRSAAVADALAARLTAEPASRVLVLCAAAHAVPAAWLSRQLPVEPCVLRTDQLPPLRTLGERAATAGRVFRRGPGRVYAWVLDDVFADAGLGPWAAAWNATPR